jgi:ABC-2 type transport system permease protein
MTLRRSFALLFHEWRKIFQSPSYFVLGSLFLFLSSLLFLFIVQSFLQEAQGVRPTVLWLETFWIGSLLLIPLLSMRSVAEERANGTLDGLLCSTLSPFTIILCKFLALLSHYLTLWIFAICLQPLSFFFSAIQLPFPLFTIGDFLNGISFLALIGSLHIACAIFFSAISRTPVQAGAATLALLLLFYFGPRAVLDSTSLAHSQLVRNFFLRCEIFPLLSEWTCGIFDTRTIIFYVSSTVAVLLLSAAFLRRP